MRSVRLFSFFQISFSLLFWVPTFYAFQKTFGLSDASIFSIQSLYYFAFCVLEIPTGLIADRVGYRFCLRAGALISCAANLIPVLHVSVLSMTAHFLLVALARSLISGAGSAYLFQLLEKEGQSALYRETEGSIYSASLIARIIGWSGVGLLATRLPTLPYIATVVAALFSVGASFLLTDVRSESKRMDAFLGEINHALRATLGSSHLMALIFQGTVVFVLVRLFQINLMQPILLSKGVSAAHFGILLSVMSVFEAYGARRPSFRTLLPVIAVMAMSLVAIPWGGAYVAIGALSVFSWACGVAYPIQKQLVNEAIPAPGLRATILSLESLIDRASSSVAALVMGYFLARNAMNGFLILSAVLSVVVVVLFGRRQVRQN